VNAPGANLLPKQVKHIIRLTEMIWSEIMKITKLNIVIKTPDVLLGNIMSNLMLSVQMGMNPYKVLKMQLEGMRALGDFLQQEKDVIALEMEQKKLRLQKAGSVRDAKMERVKNEINRIKGDMKASPIKDLMDAGLYQAIIEDINVEDLKATNRVSRRIHEKTEKLPQMAQDAIDQLYLTDRTSIFKMMTQATQMSDFVARYALYNHMKSATDKHGARKNTDQQALNTVIDSFIYYGAPDSKVLQYMNDMGLVMFTKFFLRIQKVLKNAAKGHPVEFLTSILAQEMLDMDVEDVTDQSIFTKNYGAIWHWPHENLMEAMTPQGPEFVDDVLNRVF